MAMSLDMEIDIRVPDSAHTANSAKLLELAMKGDLLQFQALMVKRPLDFTAGSDIYNDKTSLHMGALHGQVQIVTCIMSIPNMSMQSVNATDRFGYTPLHLAVRSKHESIVRILIKSSLMLPDRVLGATSGRDELGKDCDGVTPLHLATAGENLTIVKLLLQQSIQRGAGNEPVNIQATTWQGFTALDIAKQRNHAELMEILECFDVHWLELERQKSANSMNAFLVGAALVATVAFGCWQQPPLGIPTWDQSASTNVDVMRDQALSEKAAGAKWLVFPFHCNILLMLRNVPCDWNSCPASI